MATTCFLHLLGPATDPVACVCYGHLYTQTSEPPAHPLPRHTVVLPLDSDNITQLPVKEEMERFKQEMTLSPDKIKEVESTDRVTILCGLRKGGIELQHQSVGKYYKGQPE